MIDTFAFMGFWSRPMGAAPEVQRAKYADNERQRDAYMRGYRAANIEVWPLTRAEAFALTDPRPDGTRRFDHVSNTLVLNYVDLPPLSGTTP